MTTFFEAKYQCNQPNSVHCTSKLKVLKNPLKSRDGSKKISNKPKVGMAVSRA